MGRYRMNRENSLVEGKILGSLLRFAIPVFLALFLQALYGGVDLLVVGQFADKTDISGVSLGSLITQTMTIFVTGLSMGITVLVGRRIGEKKPELAGKSVGSGICLFSVVAVALTIVMILCAGCFASWIATPEEAVSQTVNYIRICGIGTIFIVAYNVIGSIFRGIGDAKTPLIVVAIACITNIAGDLLLVAVFHWGASGAAVATVAAQCVSVLISVLIIAKKKNLPFRMTKKDIRFDKTIILEEIKLGMPIALQDTLTCLAFLFIESVINSFGLDASAGVGIAEKINQFLWLVPSALMQSMSVFVAQNLGADQLDRARKALRYGLISAFVIGSIFSYLSFFHGDLLAMIFNNKDAAVIAYAHTYLKATGIACLLSSVLFCFTGYFNGCGKTIFVMIQGLLGSFLVRIPVAYIMNQMDGATIFHVGLGMPLASMLQLLLCIGLYVYLIIKERKGHYANDNRQL